MKKMNMSHLAIPTSTSVHLLFVIDFSGIDNNNIIIIIIIVIVIIMCILY